MYTPTQRGYCAPDLGSTRSLPRRAERARAFGISLLGDRISADDAGSMALIWKSVDDTDLDAEIASVSSRLAKTSPEGMTRIRHSIDAAATNQFTDQLDLETEHQSVFIPRNMVEGAKAFTEKREPHFKGRD